MDDSDERSQGSVGITAGAGFFKLAPGNMLTESGGGAFGAQLLGHLGFWSVAPARGLANGVELRAKVRLWGSVAVSPLLTVEALVSAHYYFGFFGIGVAGDFRFVEWTTPGQLAQNKMLTGVGPSLSVAFIDNRRVRLVARWPPNVAASMTSPSPSLSSKPPSSRSSKPPSSRSSKPPSVLGTTVTAAIPCSALSNAA